MQANDSQTAAITHLRGPCLVLAGPGSGKTFTITKRILYLLEQGIPPETILVITFTKEAALSMQNRFREMSGLSYPVNFGTFHSVFYHMLRASNALKSNKLLSSSEKKNLLFPILKSYEEKRQKDKTEENSSNSLNEDAVQILAAISFYKNTMHLTNTGAKVPEKWKSCFEEIFQEYESSVKKTNRLDFDDMLYNCKKMLEGDPAVKNYWQNRFTHILIDEFQDINPVQYEVIKLLAAEPYNIFAVGDDDQAIYGFRGSEPDCMKRFVSEFCARQLLLDVNYRSMPEIVRASLEVIGENKNRFVKQLKAAANATGTVGIKAFAAREEQYGYLMRSISEQLQAGEGCAVLFRTNSYMQAFAARLKAADIPYEMRERAASIYEHFIVSDIMAYMQIARGEGEREQMLRIMNRPSRFISREAVGEGRVDIRKMMEYYRRAQMPAQQKSNAIDALSRLEKQLQSIGRLSPLPAVNYILKAVEYERYLKELSRGRQEKWQEWQELLEWLKEDADKFACYREWRDFQKEYTLNLEQENGQTKERHAKEPDKRAAVQLLTAHGAKGLEFDKVWIPDCNEKNFPHGTMPDERTVEEERRIFYVAMTRARKSLELLYLAGTKERPRQCSRFINPLIRAGISQEIQQ